MRRVLSCLFLLLATAALADELAAPAIISAFKLGATPEAVIAQINNPANTVAPLTQADIASLKAANVPEGVIQALMAKAPVPTPTPAPPAPDNPKLADLVRMVKSGLSEPIILDQLKRSGETYQLSANDLVYLKYAGVPESIIAFLVSSKAPSAAAVAGGAEPATMPAPTPEPKVLTVEGVVLHKPTFMQKDRPGRLVFNENDVQWVDALDPKMSFGFKMTGVEKVWLSCQARTAEAFCYQINIQIVKGAHYRFQDANRQTGSNDAVKVVESWIKKHFPSIAWGPQDVDS